MHIVHIIEPVEMGGVFTWVYEVCNELVAQGHQVSVIHSIRPTAKADWRTHFKPEVKLIHVQMSRSIHPVTDGLAFFKITRLLQQMKPDVIHSHSSKAGFLSRLSGFILGNNQRQLYTSHGVYFPNADNQIKYYLYKGIEKIGYALGGTIASCSPEENKILQSHITGENSTRLININNGVDERTVSRYLRDKRNPEIIKVGVHGRISHKKGSQRFAQLAAKLLPEFPNVKFLWIGGGDDADEAELTSAGVTVTGELSREKAIGALSDLDIFLQTSLYEAMSLSLLEAQFAALPAIVSDAPGNTVVVKHGENGLAAKDLAEMELHLKQLINDHALRESMAEKALARAREHFSFAHMVEQYLTAYEQLAQSSAAGLSGSQSSTPS